MRIHTSLTENDLRKALPKGVQAYITPHGSRKRDRAYEVTLYVIGKDSLHRRYANSGQYGNAEDVAATWDEWGVWMDRLYRKDPDAIIGWYETRAMFEEVTRNERDRIIGWNKPESLQARTHKAPWLA